MNRRHYIERIQDALGDQKLIWVGTRGHDAIGLMDIPQFSEAYGIIAPLGSLSLEVDLALEQLSKRRVDLDTYTIDDDWSSEANEFRRRLLASLTEPTCVVAYRSLALLSSICYPRSEFVTFLGMFHERQATFEHKPWVETELRKADIRVIPWRYFSDEDRLRLEEELIAKGELVLRSNRSDGGAGFGSVGQTRALATCVPHRRDGFLAAAPLLEPHIPLNINACVFPNGEVTLHPASLQLIGIQRCTRRRFGYCGNDFVAIRDLDIKTIDHFEDLTRKTAAWLHSQGYVGAFGVDALIHAGEVYLTEINPRFQGSSPLSARIDGEADEPDLYLCHIAALLGLSPPGQVFSLWERISYQEKYSQIVMHNCTSDAVFLDETVTSNLDVNIEIEPPVGIKVNPDAIIARLIANRAVTGNGRSIDPQLFASLGEMPESKTKTNDILGAFTNASNYPRVHA